MTLVHTETGEVVSDLSADAARDLTEKIATGIGMVWQLVRSAYEGRAWIALGYGSWDDYCGQEFAGARIQLPREERQEVVGSLRDAGLSIRAIAAATGTSVGTVHADLGPGVQNRTPDDGPTEPDIAPPKTTGTDGKSYRRTADPDADHQAKKQAEREAEVLRKVAADMAAEDGASTAENAKIRSALARLLELDPATTGCTDPERRLLRLQRVEEWCQTHREALNSEGGSLHLIDGGAT